MFVKWQRNANGCRGYNKIFLPQEAKHSWMIRMNMTPNKLLQLELLELRIVLIILRRQAKDENRLASQKFYSPNYWRKLYSDVLLQHSYLWKSNRQRGVLMCFEPTLTPSQLQSKSTEVFVYSACTTFPCWLRSIKRVFTSWGCEYTTRLLESRREPTCHRYTTLPLSETP